MTDARTRLIFNYRATSTYGLNVLLGALETESVPSVDIVLARTPEDLETAVRSAPEIYGHVLVAWSFYSPQFLEMAEELRRFRKAVDDARIVHIAGGVHATGDPEQTLRAGFDLVAIGEGEKTILEVVRRISHAQDCKRIPGIAHLYEGKYVSNGMGEMVDLNMFPPFAPEHKRFNPIEITRGCIYACRFCQTPFMFKAKFRHRTVENVCHYVRIMKNHGLKDTRFITPTSLSYGSSDQSVNLDAIERLLSSVREILGPDGRIFFGTFPSEVRPEHVTPSALRMLKKYVNNNNLIIGAQSGSLRVLEKSRRGHGVEQIEDAVRYTVEAGFIPNVDFIFGLPGEGHEEIDASLILADKLATMGARIHGHTFMPLPGTPFRNEAPGRIPPGALRRLKRLESRGGLYGQWKEQVNVARELSEVSRRGALHVIRTVNPN